jgi:HD superfamily phosphodiesterase
MDNFKAKVARLLIEYFENDNRRIEHAFAVLKESEILQAKSNTVYDDEIVIAAALLHDIGIKISEEKLGYNNGKTQEEYGPPIAEELLKRINFPPTKIAIVKDIISNHHSPSKFDYPELELLKQADRIVNKNES